MSRLYSQVVSESSISSSDDSNRHAPHHPIRKPVGRKPSSRRGSLEEEDALQLKNGNEKGLVVEEKKGTWPPPMPLYPKSPFKNDSVQACGGGGKPATRNVNTPPLRRKIPFGTPSKKPPAAAEEPAAVDFVDDGVDRTPPTPPPSPVNEIAVYQDDMAVLNNQAPPPPRAQPAPRILPYRLPPGLAPAPPAFQNDQYLNSYLRGAGDNQASGVGHPNPRGYIFRNLADDMPPRNPPTGLLFLGQPVSNLFVVQLLLSNPRVRSNLDRLMTIQRSRIADAEIGFGLLGKPRNPHWEEYEQKYHGKQIEEEKRKWYVFGNAADHILPGGKLIDPSVADQGKVPTLKLPKKYLERLAVDPNSLDLPY